MMGSIRRNARALLRLPADLKMLLEEVRTINARMERRDAPRQKHNSANDLYWALHQSALEETVAIVQRDMPEALIFTDHHRFLRHALSKAPAAGAHCEFGVWSGGTINFLAKLRPSQVFDGFDSFEGLPEEWTGHEEFDFNRRGEVPEVQPNVVIHSGWFDATLPAYAATVTGVAFLHVDCDIYSSTASIFEHLGSKLNTGCVVVFDEYFCYPGFEQHELRAFAEFVSRSGRRPRWIAVNGQKAACILD